jgi:hypothetical protein
MAGSEPTPEPSRWQLVVTALLAVVVCAAFLPALDVFISGDDFEWLESSYDVIEDPLSSFRLENNFFRPLVKWTYLFDYLIFGQLAVGYMITNLAIHFLNVLLLFCLLRRRLRQPLVAAAATAAFALSPLHSEGVLWGAGRPDTLLPIFFLAAILLLDLWCERQTALLVVAFTAVALVGIGAKEAWIVFPFIATAYPPLVCRVPVAATLRSMVAVWVAWLIYVVVFLVAPTAAGSETAAHYADFRVLPGLYKTASTVFAYFGLGFAPAQAWVLAVTILVAVGILVWLLRNGVGFGLWAMVWLFATLAVVAPFQVSVLRHNYMPLLGFWMVLASIFDRVLDRKTESHRRFAVMAAALVAVIVIVAEARALQREVADYRLYGELHLRLCQSYSQVAERISHDIPLVLIDRSTFRGVEFVADRVRGIDKTFFVRRDALWQMVFLPPLANFLGRPFEERLVRESLNVTDGLPDEFTVLLFDDGGFALRPDLRRVVSDATGPSGELPLGVSLYRFTVQ